MADPIFDKRRLIRATGQSPAALAVTEGAVPAVVSPVQRFVVGRDQLPHSLSEPELAALGACLKMACGFFFTLMLARFLVRVPLFMLLPCRT